jgi:hypothetical protein
MQMRVMAFVNHVRVARVLWDPFMMTAAAYEMAGPLAKAVDYEEPILRRDS